MLKPSTTIEVTIGVEVGRDDLCSNMGLFANLLELSDGRLGVPKCKSRYRGPCQPCVSMASKVLQQNRRDIFFILDD